MSRATERERGVGQEKGGWVSGVTMLPGVCLVSKNAPKPIQTLH